MCQCIDDRYGEMLFAYELDLLPQDQEREFEEHMLECKACWTKLDQFANVTQHLRYSDRIRSFLRDSSPEEDAKKRRSVFTRPLIIAALLLVLVIPVYQVWFRSSVPEVTQRLRLLPVRGQSDSQLLLAQGGTAEIQFVVKGAVEGSPLQLTIISRTGDTVFADPGFTNFTSQGKGVLELPVDSFEPGFYTLTITDSFGNLTDSTIQYSFRVR